MTLNIEKEQADAANNQASKSGSAHSISSSTKEGTPPPSRSDKDVKTTKPSPKKGNQNTSNNKKKGGATVYKKKEDPDVFTTIMLKNIPNKYTREMLKAALDFHGFNMKYDFLYLPIDYDSNPGYCFIDFKTDKARREFEFKFNEKPVKEVLPAFKSVKVCEVVRANYQRTEDDQEEYEAKQQNFQAAMQQWHTGYNKYGKGGKGYYQHNDWNQNYYDHNQGYNQKWNNNNQWWDRDQNNYNYNGKNSGKSYNNYNNKGYNQGKGYNNQYDNNYSKFQPLQKGKNWQNQNGKGGKSYKTERLQQDENPQVVSIGQGMPEEGPEAIAYRCAYRDYFTHALSGAMQMTNFNPMAGMVNTMNPAWTPPMNQQVQWQGTTQLNPNSAVWYPPQIV